MRKSILASSLKAVQDRKQGTPDDGGAPARKTSGVMAVQRGLDHLSAGAPQEIDTALIRDSAIRDRFDVGDGLEDLLISIQRSGQRLPVLLRRTGDSAGDDVMPYEVVFGRRRIEACRRLGIPVRAHIAEMSDRDALLSQGLENAARLQRSYIEQALYARDLLDHALPREEIMDVLAVDETTVSRMLGVARAIPDAVVRAIGPAHDAGRRPWLRLRDLLRQRDDLAEAKVVAMIDGARPSRDRLMALIKALSAADPASGTQTGEPQTVSRALPGGQIRLQRGPDRLLVTMQGPQAAGFADFLDARMDALLAEFNARKTGQRTDGQDKD